MNFAVIDEAIRNLRVWERSCEQDNGIRHLLSGGGPTEIAKWYNDMEAARTPEQRANEITQKLYWEQYEKSRKPMIELIKRCQKIQSYPTFGIPDYEGVWDTFKAPSQIVARKFLQIRNNRTTFNPTPVRAKKIKPDFQKMGFS